MATRKRKRPAPVLRLEELAAECQLAEQQLEERGKRELKAEEAEAEEEGGEEKEPTFQQLYTKTAPSCTRERRCPSTPDSPLLLELLQARWWQADRRRPAPLVKEDALSSHAHVALLVDTASLEVYRPRTTGVEESKLYYDEKNRIHALKKEVAVMASPPHLALFAFPGAAGSRQDHSILKEHYAAYIPYLTKTAAEEALLQPVDGEEACWSALFGSGYAWCNASDTPGLRRVVLKKNERRPVGGP